VKFSGMTVLLAGALALAGCGTSYSWRSEVPADRRSVSVPTFINRTAIPELGAVVTRQVLRELQREGTFRLQSADDAAIELQGEVVSMSGGTVATDRRGSRRTPQVYEVSAKVTAIDRRNQRVMFDGRTYTASVGTAAGADVVNAKRDVSGRLADELSRQIVDDLLNYKW